MINYRKITYICFYAVASIVITGCASLETSASYDCDEIVPWVEHVKRFGGVDEGYSPDYFAQQDLIIWVSPAFHDDLFIPTFGKSYSSLDKKELNGIRYSLYGCYTEPWIYYGVTNAFFDSNVKDFPAWQVSIARVNRKTYAEVIASRPNDLSRSTVWTPEKGKIASRVQKEKRQREHEEWAKKEEQIWKNIVVGATGLAAVGVASNMGSHARETQKYAHYGKCATKLADRLLTCQVSIIYGGCNSTGCDNYTECDKGLKGRSCKITLADKSETGTYYCDSENRHNHSKNQEEVINKICSNN